MNDKLLNIIYSWPVAIIILLGMSFDIHEMLNGNYVFFIPYILKIPYAVIFIIRKGIQI